MKNIIKFILLIALAFAFSSTFALEIQTEEKACTKEYMPVCAEVQVQCIMAPCPPLKETFSNKCEMENNRKNKCQNHWYSVI